MHPSFNKIKIERLANTLIGKYRGCHFEDVGSCLAVLTRSFFYFPSSFVGVKNASRLSSILSSQILSASFQHFIPNSGIFY